jgi:hypothetical protein
MLPDSGMCRKRPGKLPQVSCQPFVHHRVGLKCKNLAIRSNFVRSRDSVIANVAAHVKINVTRFNQRVQTGSHVRFIGSGPHLPLDSIGQIRFKPHTRPRRCHRSVSTNPAG